MAYHKKLTKKDLAKLQEFYYDAYDELYTSGKWIPEYVDEFDSTLKNNKSFKENVVRPFVAYNGDVISSDRECMAFIMAYNMLRKLREMEKHADPEFNKKLNSAIEDSIKSMKGHRRTHKKTCKKLVCPEKMF